jgi:hypothetical protein
LPSNNQSLRWIGEVYLPAAGDYTFFINSLGPQRLTVDGVLVVEDFDTPSDIEQSGTYTATGAGWVSILYEVVDTSTGGSARALLQWSTPENPTKRLVRSYEVVETGVAGVADVRPVLRTSADAFSDGSDDDFHLKSLSGSWHGGVFALDDANSPGIDSGDLVSGYALESTPNGGRINLGAYGNTAEASRSTSPSLQLLSPNGLEKYRADGGVVIEWRTIGEVAFVDVALSLDGGTSFTPLASGLVNDGNYSWNPLGTDLTNQALIRISSTLDPVIEDVSDALFTIGVAGNTYYVNDGSEDNDQYTNAVGNNSNTGTTPDDPMASISAVISSYDLEPGDIIYVDTGNYSLSVNIIITAADEGVTIQGPTDAGTVALLDRANTAGGSYGIQLNNADGVTIYHLSITGGENGIWVDNGSSEFTLRNSVLYENSSTGVNIRDAASSGAVVQDKEFYGDASVTVRDQNYGLFSRGLNPVVERNVAYHINGRDDYGIYLENAGTEVVVRDNLFYNNSNTGLVVSASFFEISGNVARNNATGFSIDDTTGVLTGMMFDNVAYGNSTGFNLAGDGHYFDLEAFDNGEVFLSVGLE